MFGGIISKKANIIKPNLLKHKELICSLAISLSVKR
jgi:hypothetical protein